jgi:hypothetical protein
MGQFFANRRPLAPAKELYELLQELGMENGELARHPDVQVTPNTVSRWIHRKTSPPVYVLAMLRRRVAAKRRRETAA